MVSAFCPGFAGSVSAESVESADGSAPLPWRRGCGAGGRASAGARPSSAGVVEPWARASPAADACAAGMVSAFCPGFAVSVSAESVESADGSAHQPWRRGCGAGGRASAGARPSSAGLVEPWARASPAVGGCVAGMVSALCLGFAGSVSAESAESADGSAPLSWRRGCGAGGRASAGARPSSAGVVEPWARASPAASVCAAGMVSAFCPGFAGSLSAESAELADRLTHQPWRRGCEAGGEGSAGARPSSAGAVDPWARASPAAGTCAAGMVSVLCPGLAGSVSAESVESADGAARHPWRRGCKADGGGSAETSSAEAADSAGIFSLFSTDSALPDSSGELGLALRAAPRVPFALRVCLPLAGRLLGSLGNEASDERAGASAGRASVVGSSPISVACAVITASASGRGVRTALLVFSNTK